MHKRYWNIVFNQTRNGARMLVEFKKNQLINVIIILKKAWNSKIVNSNRNYKKFLEIWKWTIILKL